MSSLLEAIAAKGCRAPTGQGPRNGHAPIAASRATPLSNNRCRSYRRIVRPSELHGAASVLSVDECDSMLQCIPLRDSLSAHIRVSPDPEIGADGGLQVESDQIVPPGHHISP